jgi:RNA polymerase sigma factor (TIGR02999 family)
LQPTALVHEAYLQLIDQKEMNWQGRAHFLAMAATTIRRVLIDHARLHYAGKRGGDRKPITLPDGLAAVTSDPLELMTLDEAMKKLRVVSSRQCDVVECRFFGGLSVEETALVLGFSERTVKTDWRMARAWLLKSMEEHGPPGRHWARMAKKRYASSRLLVGNCMRKEGTRRQRNCF